jgi:hypothetical protein
VPVEPAGTTFASGNPAPVLERAYYLQNLWRTYDVSPDGRRFLMIKEGADDAEARAPQLVIVLNWFEKLKRLAPARRNRGQRGESECSRS